MQTSPMVAGVVRGLVLSELVRSETVMNSWQSLAGRDAGAGPPIRNPGLRLFILVFICSTNQISTCFLEFVQ